MKAAKIAWRILKWILILVAALVVAVVGSWALIPDEAPHPELQKVLAPPALPPSEQNAYFAVWGLDASPDLDPHATGRKIVEEHERLLAAKTDLTKLQINSFLGPAPLSLELSGGRCKKEEKNCLAFYQAMPEKIRADTAKYAIYIERYRAIRAYPHFSERPMSLTAVSPLPRYAPILGLGGLVDAGIALDMALPARRKAAVEELAAEVAMWRRILQNSDMLITQMVAASSLQQKYRLASEIMASYPDMVRTHQSFFADIAAPLAAKGIDFPRILKGEFRVAAPMFRELKHTARDSLAQTGFLEKAFGPVLLMGYQPTATLNTAYANYLEHARFYAKSPGDIVTGHAGHAARQENFMPWHPKVLFYNPVGKILVGVAAPDYGNYAFRLHDLIGFSRLLDLQRRIAAEGIRSEQIPAFLTGAGLTNPYTDAPMEWDAAAKTVWFSGHGMRSGEERRVQVRLGSVVR